MIRYRLRCEKRHEFDGWFASGAAFDRQVKRGLISCPHCETVLDRDLNAAKNILAVGQTVTARGASVRARRATARRAGRQRSANHLERTLHVAS